MADVKTLKAALFLVALVSLIALALSGCTGAPVGRAPPCPRPGPKVAAELATVEPAPEFWRWMARLEVYCDGIDALRERGWSWN